DAPDVAAAEHSVGGKCDFLERREEPLGAAWRAEVVDIGRPRPLHLDRVDEPFQRQSAWDEFHDADRLRALPCADDPDRELGTRTELLQEDGLPIVAKQPFE